LPDLLACVAALLALFETSDAPGAFLLRLEAEAEASLPRLVAEAEAEAA